MRKICRNGHDSKRYANGRCVECCHHKFVRAYARKLKNRYKCAKMMLYRAKRRSVEKELVCTVTTEQILGKWPLDNKCPILESEFVFESRSLAGPSLDRKDPKQGYTVDNIGIISRMGNILKNAITPEQIERLFNYTKS